jgi:hypothetical protein
MVFYVIFTVSFIFYHILDFFDPWIKLKISDKVIVILLLIVSPILFPIVLGFIIAGKFEDN